MHMYGIIEAGKQEVRGMRLRCSSSQWSLEHFAAAAAETPLSGALAKVYTELAAWHCDFVAVTGNLPCSGCFELYMPRLKLPELEAALAFELPRYLPDGMDGILWRYRVLDFTDKTAPKYRVRIFFVLKAEWENFTGELEQSGIKADAFIHPFMAVDPELSDMPVYLPETDAKFYFAEAGQDGLRQMEQVSSCADSNEMLDAMSTSLGYPEDMEPELAKRCMVSLLTAKYISGKNFGKNGDHSQLPLPPSLYPQRCRWLKRLTLSSGLAALVSLSLWMGSEWHKLYGCYSALQQEIVTVKQQLDTEKTFLRQNASQNKAMSKVLTTLPKRKSVLQLLCYLATKLPNDIAVNSYNLQGNKVNLTMKCVSDPENALAQVGDSARYNVENLRKNRNHDGSYNLYLVLTIND